MTEKELLLVQLDQAFKRKSWHGTNLMGSLRGLRPELAAYRPAKDRHNIWEILLHCAYWKYSVYRRLAELPTGSFALKGSNWFPRPVEGSASELKADIGLLKTCHGDLISAVMGFQPRRLSDIPSGSKTTFRDLIIGAASHDLYHCGQIQLIKKLRK